MSETTIKLNTPPMAWPGIRAALARWLLRGTGLTVSDPLGATIPPGMIGAVARAIHAADPEHEHTCLPLSDEDRGRRFEGGWVRFASQDVQAMRVEQAEAAVTLVLGWRGVPDDA